MSKILKASTYNGKRVIAMSDSCIYTGLQHIYGKWSQAKQEAYDYCLDQFSKDCDSRCFGVGNANCFGFTASWLLTFKGEPALRVETKDTSYIVLLDR